MGPRLVTTAPELAGGHGSGRGGQLREHKRQQTYRAAGNYIRLPNRWTKTGGEAAQTGPQLITWNSPMFVSGPVCPPPASVHPRFAASFASCLGMRQRETGGGGEVLRLSGPRLCSTLSLSAGAAVVGLVVVSTCRGAQCARDWDELGRERKRKRLTGRGGKRGPGSVGTVAREGNKVDRCVCVKVDRQTPPVDAGKRVQGGGVGSMVGTGGRLYGGGKEQLPASPLGCRS